ncbi:MAG: hypothetical protein Ct9H300mP6_00930 [Gammaproteobacteria bacterium]|nr:MAG: hypothetical protein Ct9H300mP6_00930 [Gammaproteobacteria bacterium]
MGLSENKDFASQMDQSTWPKMKKELTKCFSKQPLDHWQDLFEGSDACVEPVFTPEESKHHPPINERDIWVEVDDPNFKLVQRLDLIIQSRRLKKVLDAVNILKKY